MALPSTNPNSHVPYESTESSSCSSDDDPEYQGANRKLLRRWYKERADLAWRWCWLQIQASELQYQLRVWDEIYEKQRKNKQRLLIEPKVGDTSHALRTTGLLRPKKPKKLIKKAITTTPSRSSLAEWEKDHPLSVRKFNPEHKTAPSAPLPPVPMSTSSSASLKNVIEDYEAYQEQDDIEDEFESEEVEEEATESSRGRKRFKKRIEDIEYTPKKKKYTSEPETPATSLPKTPVTQRKKIKTSDYDIDNVVIPPSIYANILSASDSIFDSIRCINSDMLSPCIIQVVKPKEILTPIWRSVSGSKNSAPQKMSHRLLEENEVSLPSTGDQSSEENTDDEIYSQRHIPHEVQERKRYELPPKEKPKSTSDSIPDQFLVTGESLSDTLSLSRSDGMSLSKSADGESSYTPKKLDFSNEASNSETTKRPWWKKKKNNTKRFIASKKSAWTKGTEYINMQWILVQHDNPEPQSQSQSQPSTEAPILPSASTETQTLQKNVLYFRRLDGPIPESLLRSTLSSSTLVSSLPSTPPNVLSPPSSSLTLTLSISMSNNSLPPTSTPLSLSTQTPSAIDTPLSTSQPALSSSNQLSTSLIPLSSSALTNSTMSSPPTPPTPPTPPFPPTNSTTPSSTNSAVDIVTISNPILVPEINSADQKSTSELTQETSSKSEEEEESDIQRTSHPSTTTTTTTTTSTTNTNTNTQNTNETLIFLPNYNNSGDLSNNHRIDSTLSSREEGMMVEEVLSDTQVLGTQKSASSIPSIPSGSL